MSFWHYSPSQSPGRSTEEKDDDESSSIVSSVTGFPGAVGFSVAEGEPFERGDGLLAGASGCWPGRSEVRRASGGRAGVLVGSGDSMQIERQMASKVNVLHMVVLSLAQLYSGKSVPGD